MLVEKCVSEPNIVSCDVTQTPDRLFLYLDVSRWVKDADQNGDCMVFDEFQNELTVTGGDVGQAPDRFELQLRWLSVYSELEQAWNKVPVNGLLDRRLIFEWEQFAEASRCKDLHHQYVRHNQISKVVKVSLLRK